MGPIPITFDFWPFTLCTQKKLTDFWPLKIKNIWNKTCDFWPFDSYPWPGPVTCDFWGQKSKVNLFWFFSKTRMLPLHGQTGSLVEVPPELKNHLLWVEFWTIYTIVLFVQNKMNTETPREQSLTTRDLPSLLSGPSPLFTLKSPILYQKSRP